MYQFLGGAVAMSSAAVGLFFLHLWRQTRDRLFLAFSVAFFLEVVSRTGLAMYADLLEAGVLFYLLRALAFGLILAGIVDKNRAR